jgi:aryl-alcohol dehydrogenase-like predicted oxidoreductase
MERRKLGKTGFYIAPVVFGGIINTDETQEDANRFVSYTIERGVNYFDVAPSYGNAEERLGAALKPYRKDVFLACKTVERGAKASKDELLSSLKLLHTDYFDVYQLHSIRTKDDVDTAFAKDGVMETVEWAKREGLIRKAGITAHSDEYAMSCIDLYDFDTVLFTLNWALAMLCDYGGKLAETVKARDIGFLCMKVLAHRMWLEGEERDYRKCWYKPVALGSDLALAAMKHALSKGADALVPPGNFDAFSYMLAHIDEAIANPLSPDDISLLKAEAEKIKEDALKLI